MKNPLILLFLSCTLFTCSSDDETPEPQFNLKGAVAVVYSADGILTEGSSKKNYLFKIMDSGDQVLTPIAPDTRITDVDSFLDGLIIVVPNEGDQTFYVTRDNTILELPRNIGHYIGENLQGDLIFSNNKIFRKATLSIEEIATEHENSYIQSVSGNFAVLITGENNSEAFAINTVTDARHEIGKCNGPRLLAINATNALISDCEEEILLNMTTGVRAATEDLTGWDGEGVTVTDGLLLLSHCINSCDTYGLGVLNAVGAVTPLNEFVFTPYEEELCSNCGYPNSMLFHSDVFTIVRETDGIVAMEGDGPPVQLALDATEVVDVAVVAHRVYYLAKRADDTPIVGLYNVRLASQNTLWEGLTFDKIMTFKAEPYMPGSGGL